MGQHMQNDHVCLTQHPTGSQQHSSLQEFLCCAAENLSIFDCMATYFNCWKDES